jgi:drug/metabolite transporter (DMT)-like permease
MLTIITGLCSALTYACSDTLTQNASRRVGVTRVLVWVLVTGLVLIVPVALLADGLPAGGAQWRAAGIASLTGLLYLVGYRSLLAALRRGDLSLIAALSSLSGAFTAVIALLRGERVTVMLGAGLILAIAGGLMASIQGRARTAAGAGLAVFTGLVFAVILLCYQLADALAPLSIAAFSRLTATVIFVPVAVIAGTPALDPRLRRIVLPAAVLEVVGLSLSATSVWLGPLAVSGVMQSQFATFAVIIGVVFLGERPRPHQIAGIVLTIAGVTVLSAAT